ncbi:hypothetical protein N2152v2_006436 [Parachlorella kessleri]
MEDLELDAQTMQASTTMPHRGQTHIRVLEDLEQSGMKAHKRDPAQAITGPGKRLKTAWGRASAAPGMLDSGPQPTAPTSLRIQLQTTTLDRTSSGCQPRTPQQAPMAQQRAKRRRTARRKGSSRAYVGTRDLQPGRMHSGLAALHLAGELLQLADLQETAMGKAPITQATSHEASRGAYQHQGCSAAAACTAGAPALTSMSGPAAPQAQWVPLLSSRVVGLAQQQLALGCTDDAAKGQAAVRCSHPAHAASEQAAVAFAPAVNTPSAPAARAALQLAAHTTGPSMGSTSAPGTIPSCRVSPWARSPQAVLARAPLSSPAVELRSLPIAARLAAAFIMERAGDSLAV